MRILGTEPSSVILSQTWCSKNGNVNLNNSKPKWMIWKLILSKFYGRLRFESIKIVRVKIDYTPANKVWEGI